MLLKYLILRNLIISSSVLLPLHEYDTLTVLDRHHIIFARTHRIIDTLDLSVHYFIYVATYRLFFIRPLTKEPSPPIVIAIPPLIHIHSREAKEVGTKSQTQIGNLEKSR